jgi:hypothetical protein
MNNSTWACFECREAVRRPGYTLKDIHCPICGEKMGYLGDRIRIPSKRQVKAWRKLRESVHGGLKGKEWQRNSRIKRLEDDIARLEASPPGATRARKIKAYKKQLAALMQ